MNKTILRRLANGLAPVALLLAGGAALQAQETGPRQTLGVAGSLVMPTGDLSEIASGGFAVGAFFELPFTKNISGSGSLQYSIFGGGEVGTVTYAIVELGVNADLQFYPNENGPLYFLGGVGFHSFAMGLSDGSTTDAADLGSEFGFNVGGGYYFNRNFGVEARYVLCADPWLQLSLKWRF